MRRIGRTRIKLAELLTKAINSQIDPEDIWIQYPNKIFSNGARWGVMRPHNDNLYSFDKMSDCIKFGFSLRHDSTGIEISAKDIT
jgi:hypothetical protein